MRGDPITEGMRRGAAVFGFLKAWKRNRKANRKAVDEIAETFNSDDKETSVFQGKLTYTGIAVLGLGWVLERFGVPVAAGELEAWVAAFVAVVGGGVALYGRWRASQK